MEYMPVVSVVVLTYNSSRFILATLESVKEQVYPNLELIVSDDSSCDDTCSKVEQWLSDNNGCFKRAILLKSYCNRGTSANYNRGVVNSKGEFVKVLDGDDLLAKPDAIDLYVNALINNNWSICISDVDVFSDENVDLVDFRNKYDFYFKCVSENKEQQKERIIKELSIPDPGLFMRRSLYDEMGGFNEDYVLLEEWPFFLKVIESGIQIMPLTDRLVKYRITMSSISHSGKSRVQFLICRDLFCFFKNELFKRQISAGMYVSAIKSFIEHFYRYFSQMI